MAYNTWNLSDQRCIAATLTIYTAETGITVTLVTVTMTTASLTTDNHTLGTTTGTVVVDGIRITGRPMTSGKTLSESGSFRPLSRSPLSRFAHFPFRPESIRPRVVSTTFSFAPESFRPLPRSPLSRFAPLWNFISSIIISALKVV